MELRDKRLLIYAQDEFVRGHSKTAEGMLQYGKNPIVAIIDRGRSGQNVGALLPWLSRNQAVPIVDSLEAGLTLKPEALLIGIAPRGGALPPEWRRDICVALEHGLHIINGLHFMMNDDPEFARIAEEHDAIIWDTRKAPPGIKIGSGLAAQVPAEVVLTIGTDSVVGKKVTALELEAAAHARGLKACFIPTGQTGIMIAGFGIAIDHVISDFVSGAVEKLVLDHARDNRFVLVEGQGSLLHPGYSGVTLGLIHGCMPGKMILCHELTKQFIRDSTIEVPALQEVIALYEMVTLPLKKGKVVGVSLNTRAVSDSIARDAVARMEAELGLPVTDPLRFGVENLLKAIGI